MTSDPSRGDFFEINEGDILCGRYRADRLIDRSDTGMVVAATDVLRGEGVAIKMIEPRVPDADEVELLAARLRREAHVLAQLTSPHVVRVFDVQKHGTMVCLVMELLHGANLGQLMRRREPLAIDEAVGIILQACDALAEAHSIGVVHRDIKPQNLFLAQRPDGSSILKVLDFGVSKQHGGMGLTATGAALGSPLYTAVEQFRDASRVDARADIWSLGLVLYFLLCRRNAFDAENPVALMLKIATAAPASLRERRPEVPPDLEAVILQCVEKDRDRRFANVAALARALVPFGPAWGPSFLPAIEARISRRSLPSLPPASLAPPPIAPEGRSQSVRPPAPVARTGSSPSWPTNGPEAHRGSAPSWPAASHGGTSTQVGAAQSQPATPGTLPVPAGGGSPWVPVQTAAFTGPAGAPPTNGAAQAGAAPGAGPMVPSPPPASPMAPAGDNKLSRQLLIFALAFLAAAALAAVSLAAVAWVRGAG